jgi:hypothetical protein
LRAPFWSDPEEHGGSRDISIGLALGLLDDSSGHRHLPAFSRPPSLAARIRSHLAGKTQGYWGDPAAASRERGDALLSGYVDSVFPRVRALLEGRGKASDFRSWYSVLPPNWSFFRAWILFFMVFLIAATWMYLMLRELPGFR